MNRFAFGEIDATDVAGNSLGLAEISGERVWRSALEVLEANVLCSMATVTPEGTAHINTAYFSYSDALEVFFLSHPASRHCRNLLRNPSIALTVFSSAQRWTDPGRGLQLFGTAEQASGSSEEEAERCYGARFSAYSTWKAALAEGDLARQYRFYGVKVRALKILDEQVLGDAVFVRAAVVRTAGAPAGSRTPAHTVP